MIELSPGVPGRIGLGPEISEDGGAEMKSFRLKMPTCPQCGSSDTKIDIRDYSKLVRMPVAVSSAGMIGIPPASMTFECNRCGVQFKDRGAD